MHFERKAKIPTLKDLLIFSGYGVVLFSLFALIYGSTNHRSAQTDDVYRLFWNWETGLPFVSSMIVVYFTLNLLTASTMFFLRGKEIHFLALTYGIAILLGGSVFYFFPTTAGFERAGLSSPWANWYSVLYSWDGPFNLFPSMHIALSSISVFCLTKEVSAPVRRFFYTWLTLICVSVVLTHQHHLIDVLGGLALGKMCVNTFFMPFVIEPNQRRA